MEKTILIGDTHFDVNSSSEEVFNQQIKFFNEQVFPYMKQNNIKNIIQLGDITDNRTKLSLYIQHRLKEEFFDIIEQNGYIIQHLLGNHDIFYKNKLDIYSMEVFKKAYSNNIIIYDTPTISKIGNNNVLFVPWLANDEIKKDMIDKIVKYEPKAIFGHFELQDFYVSKTFKATNGLDKNVFKGIQVYTGHYHSIQNENNIYYIGTPYQENWTSYGDKRGFYVLDNDTLDVEFIENVVSCKHLKVYIDSEDKTIEISDGIISNKYDINAKLDLSELNNNKVKLIIDKDNAFNKKIIEKIKPLVLSFKVDILETQEVIESEVKEFKEYNIGHSIGERLDTSYQQSVFDDIMKKSLVDMKE